MGTLHTDPEGSVTSRRRLTGDAAVVLRALAFGADAGGAARLRRQPTTQAPAERPPR